MILDRDLAVLYGVEIRTLNQAVKRNIKRFPEDFMFQLVKEEYVSLRSQFVMSNIYTSQKLHCILSYYMIISSSLGYEFTSKGYTIDDSCRNIGFH